MKKRKRIIMVLLILILLITGTIVIYNVNGNKEDSKKSSTINSGKDDGEAKLTCKNENGDEVYTDFQGTCEEYFEKEKKEAERMENLHDIFLEEHDDTRKCILTFGILKNNEIVGEKIKEYKGKIDSNGNLDCQSKYPHYVSDKKESDPSDKINSFYYYATEKKCDVYINKKHHTGNNIKECTRLVKSLYNQ